MNAKINKEDSSITIETNGETIFKIDVGKDLLIISTAEPLKPVCRDRGKYVVVRIEEKSK